MDNEFNSACIDHAYAMGVLHTLRLLEKHGDVQSVRDDLILYAERQRILSLKKLRNFAVPQVQRSIDVLEDIEDGKHVVKAQTNAASASGSSRCKRT